MATTAPAAALLDRVAELLDEALHHSTGTLVGIARDRGELELAMRPLDPRLHPCAELRGFAAPADWWAIGVVVPALAHLLDDPGSEPGRVVSTYLVSRDGLEVSLLRRSGRVERLPGPTSGRIPDLLRSALGLRS